ncbi:MAG TPA: non-canonical purine NTP pyrophosphatase, partial [Verrucomicrobiae bacterium]
MLTLLLATRNAHKVGEIRAILGDDLRYLTLNDFPDAPQVIEDAATFAGNASKKAVELARWQAQVCCPQPTAGEEDSFLVLADDSGLEVDALNGAPGVHSARFAALDSGRPGNSTDAENNAKLLRLLQDVPAERRTARFRCV